MAKQNYIVKSGDSLSIIARDQLGDVSRWREIAYINAIVTPYLIRPGQQLLMPSDTPIEVTVTEGQAAPVREAAFSFNPATVALFVGGAALLFFWDDIFGA